MRIGIFLDTYHPKINGVITSVDSLKKGLEMLGHEVFIITGGKVSKPIIKDNVILIPSIDAEFWNVSIVNFMSRKIINLIKDLKFDIVHSHSELTAGFLCNYVSQKFDIPNIHTFHTLYDEYRYYVLNNMFNAGGVAQKFLINCYLGNNIDEIIVPSQKIANELIKNYNVNKNIEIIKSGISFPIGADECQKEKLELNDDDFIILSVGRIAKEKNLKFLIDAQKKIDKINPKIKLLFVGDGPQEKELKKYVENQMLSDHIKFIGRVPYEELYKYYRLADITVSSSKTETQGLTILESLSCGTPVMCINDTAFSYIAVNGYNGFIFENQDDYIYKILTVADNDDLLQKVKKNTIVSSSDYRSENYAKKVEKIYRKLKR